MSDPQRKFQGVWIPADLWLDRDLSFVEKVMLTEINSLETEEKGCYATNAYFAEFFGLSVSRVSEVISALAAKNRISITVIREGKRIVERQIRMTPPFGKPNTPPSENTKNPFGKGDEPPSEKAKENNTKSSKPRNISSKVSLPENFAVSDRVSQWAAQKGHTRLDERLEHFVGTAKARGYAYADWDQAFMNAIREDWAKLGKSSPTQKPGFAW